jgi:WXG100 family type VII secretion target
MDNTANSDTQVYVDISAMNDWQSKITDAANTHQTMISEYKTLIGNLKNYWEGNSATAFIDNITNCLNELDEVNTQIINMGKKLQEIANVKENQ